jgi:hypothetical protein
MVDPHYMAYVVPAGNTKWVALTASHTMQFIVILFDVLVEDSN